MDNDTLTNTAGNIVGLGLFAVISGAVIGGVRKVSKKISKKDRMEWM